MNPKVTKVERLKVEKDPHEIERDRLTKLGLSVPGVTVDFGSMDKLERLKHQLQQAHMTKAEDRTFLVGFTYVDKRGPLVDSLFYVTSEPLNRETTEALEVLVRTATEDDAAKIISVSILEGPAGERSYAKDDLATSTLITSTDEQDFTATTAEEINTLTTEKLGEGSSAITIIQDSGEYEVRN